MSSEDEEEAVERERASLVGAAGAGVRGKTQAASSSRLLTRPSPTTQHTRRAPLAAAGVHPLGLAPPGSRRDGLIYAPASSLAGSEPAPLILMLHGAGADARNGLGIVQAAAEAAGALVLAVDSRGSTWDCIRSGGGWFGPDVAFIDRALAHAMNGRGGYAVDPARLAVAGFSDGASYALSLGLANADLFSHVVAFTPGFMVPPELVGRPRGVFVCAGTADAVLPVDRCSRRLVPQLRRLGYDVVYEEFEGQHTVPRGMARKAIDWVVTNPRTTTMV